MIEGKTKRIVPGPDPGTVVLISKDALTGGDAARVAAIDAIGVMKTTQAANVFALLAEAEIPTAFIRQLDERSLLCWDCEMLSVEYVLRRRPWGSYPLRHPDHADTAPFDDPVVERFHKKAMILPPASPEPRLLDEGAARAEFLRDGVWAEGIFTDPYIHPTAEGWTLHPAKKPLTPGPGGLTIAAPITPEQDTVIVETVLKPAFLILESAWRQIETPDGPIELIDCKFEVGIRRTDGALILSDVVDNDSWRIWPGGDPTKQLDKQSFRDGNPLDAVEHLYRRVTDMTSHLAGHAR